MLAKVDPIFNIPYSLPSNTHSIAIATRRPTAGNSQSIKYMPDYGGVLEIPRGNFKQNGLSKGFPFHQHPHYIRIISGHEPEEQLGPTSIDCIAIASYLNSDEPKQFTTIRAIQSELFLDTTPVISSHDNGFLEGVCDSIRYAHVPYPFPISGIKYIEELDDLLMVKFSRGLKLIQLNKSYQLPVYDNLDDSQELSQISAMNSSQSALQITHSFPEKKGYDFQDACILPHSRGMVALASSSGQDLQVKLFDINRTSKLPYNTLKRPLVDDNSETNGPNPRRRSLRSFIPSKNPIESIRHLDCDTSHLFNIVLTTSHRIEIIDPRLEGFGRTIVDKNRLDSLMPSEIIVRNQLSKCCDNQLYCMSNMNLWVFDRRFPFKPVNTIAHMLEPTSSQSMQMKLIQLNDSLETLCMSSNGRLSLVTFDRTRASTEGDSIVTPRSRHLPFHEPSPAQLTGEQSDELVGLATTTKKIFDEGFLFAVAQLSLHGDVCIRGYKPNKNQEFRRKSEAELIKERVSIKLDLKKVNMNRELEERDMNCNDDSMEDGPQLIDITTVDDITALEQNLTSTRASKKFEKMKYKLRRR